MKQVITSFWLFRRRYPGEVFCKALHSHQVGQLSTAGEQEQLTFPNQALGLTSCFGNESQLCATSAFSFIPA